MKSVLTPVFAIAKVTFSDILRDKVLYNIFLFGIFLVLVSFAASKMTFINPDRVVLDIGFSGINLACALVAILSGSAILGKEIERRTMFVALARPISRQTFIFGKYLGLVGIIAVNWLLLAGVETYLLLQADGRASATFFIGLFLLLAQGALLAALAFFFSSFMTTTLSVMILLALYPIGNSLTDLMVLIEKIDDSFLRGLFKGLITILPSFEPFNLGFNITYHLPIENKHVVLALLYAIGASAVALIAASALIRRRES